MKASDLRLADLFEPGEGVVRFAGERAIVLDAVALGLLRKQLVETFGVAAARAILTRFGWAHGWRMAERLREAFDWDTPRELLFAGRRVHILSGMFRPAPATQSPFSKTGASILDSYEAEQHLVHFGRSREPACWALGGLMSGYLSRVRDEEIFVLETRCVARGDQTCRFKADTAAGWGEALEEHRPYFDAQAQASLAPLVAQLRRVESRVRERQRIVERTLGVDENESASGIIARSVAMRVVLARARRVAGAGITVLVTGESGVGKERIARLLHDESERAGGPFVAVDCGAIPTMLVESELFGHARGSFTGALQDRVGLFEAASGGTLFLDEVGELPSLMQSKLLRALQEREVRRIGETKPRRVDVRVIAATNRDLEAAIAHGEFRADLFFRLAVVSIAVPPLRERKDDILPLARLFVDAAAARMKRRVTGLTPAALERLGKHAWPGNVRELANAMEHAVALAEAERIQPEDLPADVRSGRRAPPFVSSARRGLVEIEREAILAALAARDGHRGKAAADLGIGIATLYRRLNAYRGVRHARRRTGNRNGNR